MFSGTATIGRLCNKVYCAEFVRFVKNRKQYYFVEMIMTLSMVAKQIPKFQKRFCTVASSLKVYLYKANKARISSSHSSLTKLG